jgi:hypothetical protein
MMGKRLPSHRVVFGEKLRIITQITGTLLSYSDPPANPSASQHNGWRQLQQVIATNNKITKKTTLRAIEQTLCEVACDF